jgi:hypothetical protein
MRELTRKHAAALLAQTPRNTVTLLDVELEEMANAAWQRSAISIATIFFTLTDLQSIYWNRAPGPVGILLACLLGLRAQFRLSGHRRHARSFQLCGSCEVFIQ